MIAAPMATRNPLSYRELAKAEATVKRVIASDDLIRLSKEAVAIGATHTEFTFSFTESGQPIVRALVECEATLPCQWCLEPRRVAVTSDFEAVLARDENEAAQWTDAAQTPSSDADRDGTGQQAPEVVVAGQDFDPVRLIEDELLLSLPLQVCNDPGCPERPDDEYGVEQDSADTDGVNEGPFAALQVLKQQVNKESETN